MSGNDIEQALLALAAMHVGVPYAPISPAYSLMSSDFGKLRTIMGLLTPGLVFASDGTLFARASTRLCRPASSWCVTRNPLGRPARLRLSPSLIGAETRRVATAIARGHARHHRQVPVHLRFDRRAKGGDQHPAHAVLEPGHAGRRGFCFVAGRASGDPRLAALEPHLRRQPQLQPGARNGGTLYIDDGKPTPPGVAKTVRNLREIAPTIYFNVPKGYDALMPHLRADHALRKNFFRRLKVLFYAGAALEPADLGRARTSWRSRHRGAHHFSLRARLDRNLPARARLHPGLRPPRQYRRAGAGRELKLVPTEGRLEARLRGPNITPGYWRQDHLTRDAFDEEGFYKIGDAVKLADPDDPSQGCCSTAGSPKTSSSRPAPGSTSAPLRARFIDHYSPYVRDVVIAGADRDEIAALVFPDLEACRGLCGMAADAKPAAIVVHDAVRRQFCDAARQASSLQPRQLDADMPYSCCSRSLPSLDVGEMTDKGSINQRAVLKHRASLVEELYARAGAGSGDRTMMAEAARTHRVTPAGIRPVRLGPQEVIAEQRSDGSLHLRSPQALEAYPDKLTEWLRETGRRRRPIGPISPPRDAARRVARLTYRAGACPGASAARRGADRPRPLRRRPLVILSGNDLEHALLGAGGA